LSTQKWLNKKYSNVTGFDKVPENGRTGWPTIYGLIEGLQVELGITNLVANFGPTTEKMYDNQVTPKWGKNLPKNIVFLIQGAFWCKGINPGGFDGVYTPYLDTAVKELQTDAGFNGSAVTGVLDAKWAKALFDMSAFVLVPGGDSKIRKMQQWLNVNYLEYTGIMPCDGIYQRNSNQALIFALQAELGYSPSEATGSYGNGTTSKTYPVSEGNSGNYVRIIQYGLYVNGYFEDGTFDGIFTKYMGLEVLAFRKFMVLPEYTEIADVVVIKGLLSSAGDIRRSADGADTSTQLTRSQIQTLVDNDIKIVGRYLTGTVGIGKDERNKYLTTEELNNIFSKNLSVFPIYQDGGAALAYFTYDRGLSDGKKAIDAAKNLNIPLTTVIYFAVDLDMLGEEILAYAGEYFKGVSAVMSYSGYQTGVYGTRNVCSQIINNGYASFAFVSDMSTGYSGNLGFPMPRQWSFDQFVEFTIGSGNGAVGIDLIATSGRDSGFNELSNDTNNDNYIAKYNQKVINQMVRAYQYLSQAGLDNPWNPHLTFYRYVNYSGLSWDIISSPVTEHDRKIYDEYRNKLTNSEGLYNYFIDPNTGSIIGLPHLIVTLQSQMFLADTINDSVSDFAGWLGDLMTCWGEVKKLGIQMEQGVFALVGTAAGGTFSLEDLYQDVDAVNVYTLAKRNSDSTALSALKTYYCDKGAIDRFNQFVKNRFGSSDKIASVTNSLLENDETVDILGVGIISFFIDKIVNNSLGTDFTYLDFIGDEGKVANGFSEKIIQFQENRSKLN
ncbi:TPA: DUF1906 domain-containing protein, partial [Enterococcus faecalis]|nr:DUF1906 domain-containing protein [Enterococcus faecium]HAP4089316.1 DUF1906 domain-containing protein [Enterococcus faecalis]HAQ6833781.1 DUF1906 domain-containing protein [Enterococcus faecium]HAQ8162152.1 DUF1906 domain-containing protein [Enterococcus faecium]